MSPEQNAEILTAVADLEAWALGTLNKCSHVRALLNKAGAVSTGSKKQRRGGLTADELRDIKARHLARLTKPKTS